MATLCPMLKFREFDANGLPLVGGKVYFYASGTTDYQDVYSDPTGTTPLENPVILDSSGQRTVYLNGIYDGKVTDSDDNLMYTFEYALGGINSNGNASSILIPSFASVGTGQQSVGTLSSYTWSGGSISPTATQFKIGLTRASIISTAIDYNTYFDDTPLAVPGTLSDPTNGNLFNFAPNTVVTLFNGAEVNSDNTLFGADMVRMHGSNEVPVDYVGVQTYVDPHQFDVISNRSPFTFQIWVTFNTLPAVFPDDVRFFLDGKNMGLSICNLDIYSNDPTVIGLSIGDGAGGFSTIEATANFVEDVATFIEVCGDGSEIYFFQDGDLLVGSGAFDYAGVYNTDSFINICSRLRDADFPQVISSVLDGSWAYATFIKGVCLHTASYTPPAAPSVQNGNGGSLALRVITNGGELTSTIYSGYGTNLAYNDWNQVFSSALTGNTYIGFCDFLESDADLYTGNITITKGIDGGAGVYTWNVEADGHIENPELDGVRQVSATGYFQTDEIPVGFKIYTDNASDVEFNGGIASLSQFATTYGITGISGGPFSNHYTSTGTNTYTLTKMDDAPRPTEYFNGLEFNFTPANTNDSTDVNVIILDDDDVSLGTMDILMPDGNPPPIGFCANDVCLFCHYDSVLVAGVIDSPSVLNALMIPDDIIATDMIADDAVTNAKIADDAVDTAQIADDAVTNANIADDAVNTDQIVDDAVTEDKLATAVVDRLPFAWCCFDGTATGSNPPANGYNVTSVERNSAGKYTITFTSAAADTNYGVLATCSTGDKTAGVSTRATSTVQVWTRDDSADTYLDAAWVTALVYA